MHMYSHTWYIPKHFKKEGSSDSENERKRGNSEIKLERSTMADLSIKRRYQVQQSSFFSHAKAHHTLREKRSRDYSSSLSFTLIGSISSGIGLLSFHQP